MPLPACACLSVLVPACALHALFCPPWCWHADGGDDEDDDVEGDDKSHHDAGKPGTDWHFSWRRAGGAEGVSWKIALQCETKYIIEGVKAQFFGGRDLGKWRCHQVWAKGCGGLLGGSDLELEWNVGRRLRHRAALGDTVTMKHIGINGRGSLCWL